MSFFLNNSQDIKDYVIYEDNEVIILFYCLPALVVEYLVPL